ncbi:hypothetical protein EON65_15905 [archaeon]|nr:MAG: hypothetical protein EON65_15905 [archaeon]
MCSPPFQSITQDLSYCSDNMSASTGFSLMLSEIFSLPQDICLSVFFQWLSVQDLARYIDNNIVSSTLRAQYLDMLQTVVVNNHPDDLFGVDYLEWINRRQLKLSSLKLEKLPSHAGGPLRSIVERSRETLLEVSLSHVHVLRNEHFIILINSCASTVRHIEIDNCSRITSQCLLPVLRKTKNLQRLQLIGFDLSYINSVDTDKLTSNSLPCTEIENLKLITKLGEKATFVLFSMCPGLETLHYQQTDESNDQPTNTWLDTLAAHCPNLTSLSHTCYGSMDIQLLGKIAEKFPKLRALCIEEEVLDNMDAHELFFHSISPAPSAITSQSSAPSSAPSSLAVSLSGEPVNPYLVLSGLRCLSELDWQGPDVRIVQMLQLAEAFTSLKKVNFCNITGKKIECFCCSYVIKIIDICSMYIGVTDLVLKTLTQNNASLENITLPNCGGITDTGIRHIAMHCVQLKSLSVPECGELTNNAMQLLCTHSQSLQSLQLYSIGHSAITEESIMELGIHMASHLRKLTIGCVRLSFDVRRILVTLGIQLIYHQPDESSSTHYVL